MINRIIENQVHYIKKACIPLGNLLWRTITGAQVPVYTEFRTMLSPKERLFLYNSAASRPRKSTVVEIGTYAGGSTYFLAHGAKKSESKVYGIDPFESYKDRQISEGDNSKFLGKLHRKPTLHEVKKNLSRTGVAKEVDLIQGFSTEVAQAWNNGKVDFLWIDGNHNMAAIDYYNWKPHLSENAIVAFHDTRFPKYGKERVTRDVEAIIDSENIRDIQNVRSITSFQLNKQRN
jgi:predicted O-methyltransferase YrrM